MQYELSDNDGFGYLGNQRVKKDGVQQNFTQDQVEEYAKCMIDPVYFARKYAKVIHIDKGLIPFDLYPYQERMFQHFKSNRFSIVLACRQSGKFPGSSSRLRERHPCAGSSACCPNARPAREK